MEARQQHIADLVKNLLPCFEECRRKQRIANFLIATCTLSFIIGWGFVLRDFNRPIDINEYTALTNIIELGARNNHVTQNQMTQSICARFHIEQLQDLKARQWSTAVKFLAEQERR